jgi:hypothetical protein
MGYNPRGLIHDEETQGYYTCPTPHTSSRSQESAVTSSATCGLSGTRLPTPTFGAPRSV